MKKYKIVKHTYTTPKYINKDVGYTDVQTYRYEVKKRLFGFLWWYNFQNIDGMTTGIYNTLEEAENAICNQLTRHEKEIVREYE